MQKIKKIFGLLIGLLSCISFGYCANFSDFITYISSDTVSINAGSSYVLLHTNNSSDYGTYCVKINSLSNGGFFFGMNTTLGIQTNWMFEMYSDWDFPIYSCAYVNVEYLLFYSQYTNLTVSYDLFKLNTLLDTQVPVMTAGECQTNYNLVPSSSLESCQSSLNQCQSTADRLYQDLNTCSSSLSQCQYDFEQASGYVSSLEGELSQCTQDLINCSSSINTGSCETGNNWSALYINDIQHLGKPNIFITIPEEIDWDYTSEGDDFDLDIVGYNVDTEYIDGIIRTQNYKPTTEDFTKLVGLLAPYTKILVFLLFVFLVWAWIKKPFKSKKL